MNEHEIRDYLTGLSREQLETLLVNIVSAVEHSELLNFNPPVEYLDDEEKEWAEEYKYTPGFTHYHTGEPLI